MNRRLLVIFLMLIAIVVGGCRHKTQNGSKAAETLEASAQQPGTPGPIDDFDDVWILNVDCQQHDKDASSDHSHKPLALPSPYSFARMGNSNKFKLKIAKKMAPEEFSDWNKCELEYQEVSGGGIGERPSGGPFSCATFDSPPGEFDRLSGTCKIGGVDHTFSAFLYNGKPVISYGHGGQHKGYLH